MKNLNVESVKIFANDEAQDTDCYLNSDFVYQTYTLSFKQDQKQISFQPDCDYTIEFRYTGTISVGNTGVYATIDPDFLRENAMNLNGIQSL